jgi:hypothetical protein
MSSGTPTTWPKLPELAAFLSLSNDSKADFLSLERQEIGLLFFYAFFSADESLISLRFFI